MPKVCIRVHECIERARWCSQIHDIGEKGRRAPDVSPHFEAEPELQERVQTEPVERYLDEN